MGKLNALRLAPIDFKERIRLIAAETVHNAFHHEALTFAKGTRDEPLRELLQERIEKLSRVMQENVIEQI